jgi:hypothetical protein
VITPEERTALYADLGGIREVSEALAVNPNTLRRWIERRRTTNCPRPLRKLTNTNVYSIAEWKGWFALWRVTRAGRWPKKTD